MWETSKGRKPWLPNLSSFSDNDIFSGPEKAPWRRSADTHDAYLCKYVTTRGALKLPKYQYRSSNKSIIYHAVIQHYLKRLLPLIPLWMAPNLVTLIGLFFTAVAHGLMIFYCPLLTGVAPSWVYLANAFCFWAYQTLDHLDGKQARRTGSSSPLGLLFDHGCDAINTTTVVLNLATVWQLGPGLMTFSLWTGFCFAFYIGTLEEYYTGYLNLPYVNAPNEGLCLIYGFFAVTAVVGADFWLIDIGGVPLNRILWAVTMFCSISTIVGNVRNILNAVLTNKDFSLIVASTRLVPFLLMVGSFYIWIDNSPSDVFARHPRLILWTLGLMFAKLVTQLMIAHICDEEYHPMGKSVSIVIFTVAHAGFFSWAQSHPQMQLSKAIPIFDEEFISYEIFGIALFVYLHMMLSAIHEVKTILKIECFRIPPMQLG